MIDERKKKIIHSNWNRKIVLIYIKNGFKNISKSKGKTVFFVIFLVALFFIAACLLLLAPKPNTIFPNLNGFLESLIIVAAFALAIFLSLLLVFVMGVPPRAKQMSDNFKRAGLVNHTGEAPLLLSRTNSNENERLNIYEFHMLGIPFSLWKDSIEELESALNLKIDRFEEGKNSRTVLMYAVNGNYKLPDRINWDDKFLDKMSFKLVFGESLTNRITVDLAKIPHILIGGSTGSGKSVLLKLLLMQCVKKGAEVYIADFKGGVDFPPVWHEKCEIITEPDELTEILEAIVNELKYRKVLLKESACPNIDEYNKITNKRLNRIILACDEIAEVLDKTGLSKEDKAVVQKTENLLSVIARQGRAFGIHLILATQRPDANILSGQIKNNIDYRVCGRADNILSQIILDKADANDRVPKNAQGRFLDNHDVLFQAYWFDERRW